MAMVKQNKTEKIYCVDCGKKRMVTPQNKERVKRCFSCQYTIKREYNTDYIRKSRKLKKEK